MASGTNAFGMAHGHPPASPVRMVLSSATPMTLPGVRAVIAAAGPAAQSPVRMSSVRKSPKPSVVYGARPGACPASPATFGNLVLSPGAEIRRNAANFGIPLNLRQNTTEGVAPVPIRSGVGGCVLAPSPTARVQGLPVTTVQGSPFAPVPQLPGSAGGFPFNRPIVTPLTGC